MGRSSGPAVGGRLPLAQPLLVMALALHVHGFCGPFAPLPLGVVARAGRAEGGLRFTCGAQKPVRAEWRAACVKVRGGLGAFGGEILARGPLGALGMARKGGITYDVAEPEARPSPGATVREAPPPGEEEVGPSADPFVAEGEARGEWRPWGEVELAEFVARAPAPAPRPAAAPRAPVGGGGAASAADVYLSELLLKSDRFRNGYSVGGAERVRRRAPARPGAAAGAAMPPVASPDGLNASAWLQERRAATGRGSRGEAEEGGAGARAFFAYDPAEIARYYDSRPLTVLFRLVEAGVPLGLWAVSVLWDRLTNSLQANEAQRARELRQVLSASGPTSVKFGQALSNRPDVLGPVYTEELQQLQDNVGAFGSNDALDLIERDLGGSVEELFEELSEEPIASASLGQVYRGRLRGMRGEVAVKVQRPGLAVSVPLDMYILRKFASFAKANLKLRSDLPAILDEFATRLFEEIDYNNEAANSQRFKALYGGIDGLVVPDIYPEFCTRNVLTMEWLQGTKPPWAEGKRKTRPVEVTEAERKEWAKLIKTGVQCNLKQLLDEGFFHADPHSGNLLRTEDGRLAYLDFGMMSSLPSHRRYALIVAIVHLINRDYALLAKDFQQLGFIPTDFEDLDAMAAELKAAFGDAAEGGRLSQINFARLADNLAGIAFRFPFRIPPDYSLIIRSLTILEGIALSSDENFNIVDEAYPYVARRLLFDRSEELKDALEEILLDADTKRIKWDRLLGLVNSVGKASSDRQQQQQANTGPGGLRNGPGPERRRGGGGVQSGVDELPPEEAIRGVLEFLLSDSGALYVDALVEDVVDVADNLQLTSGVALSVFSGGLIPVPPDRPSLARLELMYDVAKALTGAVRSGSSKMQSSFSLAGLLEGGGWTGWGRF